MSLQALQPSFAVLSPAVPPCIEAGTGPDTVLFLHGLGGGGRSFEDALAAMPAGWRGVAWDMPGCGDSLPLEEMTFETLAAAAVRLLDARQIGRAVIVGHSMGGMIAQEIAARYPARVRGLVLFATSAVFVSRDPFFRMAYLADRLAPLDRGLTPVEIAAGVVDGMCGPKASAQTKERALEIAAHLPSATYRQAYACLIDFDREADLARIACPTLVLAAEHDRLSPPRTLARIAEAIPGARYRCLTDAGHIANMENPAAFNAEIARFLQDISGREADWT